MRHYVIAFALVIRIPIVILASLVSTIVSAFLLAVVALPFTEMVSLDPMVVFFAFALLGGPSVAGLIAFLLSIFAAVTPSPHLELTSPAAIIVSAVAAIGAFATTVALSLSAPFGACVLWISEEVFGPLLLQAR
jgi:hypothetical protein